MIRGISFTRVPLLSRGVVTVPHRTFASAPTNISHRLPPNIRTVVSPKKPKPQPSPVGNTITYFFEITF